MSTAFRVFGVIAAIGLGSIITGAMFNLTEAGNRMSANRDDGFNYGQVGSVMWRCGVPILALGLVGLVVLAAIGLVQS